MMAPVLECPDCNTKHPIDVSTTSVFRCNGCGRTLKVPPQFRTGTADPAMTAAMPVVTAQRGGSPNGGHTLSRRNVRAQAVYTRYGFVDGGQRRGYYPAVHGREDALVMRLDIVDALV